MSKPRNAIDRRALITASVLPADPIEPPPGGEIASILVQARPERLDAVASAILALRGCEIFGRNDRGKLVVVVDVPDAGWLGSTVNTISALPDVYSASLVFHAVDAAST